MHTINSSDILSSIETNLETNGYAVVKQFLADDTICELRELALSSHRQRLTHQAETGLTNTHQQKMRGDHIIWLDDTSENTSIQQYFSQMYALKDALNAAFYLSLNSLESHFAIYPIGTIYAKHLDQFPAQKTRKISAILYLNEAWQADDGGCLRLHLSETEHLDIQSLGGQLVMFRSERFFHEVLSAKRERVSVAGWFKTRD